MAVMTGGSMTATPIRAVRTWRRLCAGTRIARLIRKAYVNVRSVMNMSHAPQPSTNCIHRVQKALLKSNSGKLPFATSAAYMCTTPAPHWHTSIGTLQKFTGCPYVVRRTRSMYQHTTVSAAAAALTRANITQSPHIGAMFGGAVGAAGSGDFVVVVGND